MKLLLVNPPNGCYDKQYLAPPLGLLTLAAVVRKHGYKVSILDFNLELFSDPSLCAATSFYDFAYRKISEENAQVIGFTSMCLESHVSLEMARRIKSVSPTATIVLGGTHFGAIAQEVLEHFPFIDFVVSGEGEQAIVSVLDRLSQSKCSLPQSVFYRHSERVLTGVTETKRPALEDVPFPAYDLVDLERYFSLNPFRLLNYEAGRGCVFKCSFCYSPFQYGDEVRNKSPECVVADLRKLSELGAKHIFFVQDNLLNSPRWASELCQQIAAANLPLTWECYATYPQLKKPLIDLIGNAGGRGIFTGIDAVAPESQERMNKPFLRNWQQISSNLAYCLKHEIFPMCAFILEPDQELEEIEATIYTALECVRLGCEVHLNTLSLYNGTALTVRTSSREFSYSSIKPELLLDTSEVVQHNQYAEQLPWLFPYHSTYLDVKEWEVFTAKAHTLMTIIIGLSRSLYHYVVEEKKSIWPTLNYIDGDFVEWLREVSPHQRHESVVLKFIEHLEPQQISQTTRRLLRSEFAGMLLSKHKSKRVVTITVDESQRPYHLAWFINLDEPKLLSDAASEKVLKLFGQKGLRPLANTSVLPRSEWEVAFISQNRRVKLYSVSPDFFELLLRLETATVSSRTIELDKVEVELLEEDGWIWAR